MTLVRKVPARQAATGSRRPAAPPRGTAAPATAAAAAVHTRCRAAAERPQQVATIHASRQHHRALQRGAPEIADQVDSFQRNIYLPSFLCFLDHCGHAIQFLARQARGGNIQQRGHNLLRRIVEKRVQQVLHRRAFGFVARHHRHVDILQPFLLVPHVAFFFQHAQHGAHGRITGRIRHGLPHLRGRSLTALVEDVHDLPFAAAQPAGRSRALLRFLASC